MDEDEGSLGARRSEDHCDERKRVNGKDGHLTPTRAFDDALTRTGNKVKAQYYYFSQGENIGTFGQLADSEGTIKANFDVTYTPVSAQYPAPVPAQLVAQQGDTLRSIVSRVYGDSSLWYVIAEENGLSDPGAALVAGTTLTLPNRALSVMNALDQPYLTAATTSSNRRACAG